MNMGGSQPWGPKEPAKKNQCPRPFEGPVFSKSVALRMNEIGMLKYGLGAKDSLAVRVKYGITSSLSHSHLLASIHDARPHTPDTSACLLMSKS